METSALQRLYVPSFNEVVTSKGVTLVEDKKLWVRSALNPVEDFSGYSIQHILHHDQPIELHATYFSSFEDVELFGPHHLHAFIGADNRFDCQDIAGYRNRLKYHVDHHPGRDLAMPQITYEGDDFYIDRSRLKDKDTSKVEGSIFFATPLEPLNWGMWLLQGVVSARFFVQHQPADRLMAYVGRDWQRKLLIIAGVQDDKILHYDVGVTYKCDRLSTLQYSHVNLAPTEKECEIFHQMAAELAPDASLHTGRRLFLSRKKITESSGGRYRALLNEDELLAEVAAIGYEIIEPETLPLAEQVRLFREADVVVGLGGAAMFNVVFCRPGTTVISIESSTNFIYGHAALFKSLGHKAGMIFGSQDLTDESPVHKRWSVDIGRVSSVLKAL